MRTVFRKFRKEESGAVTVDWVVVCAGVVAMAVAIVVAMQSNALSLTADVNVFMDNNDPN